MTKDIYTRVLDVTRTLIEQANAVHAADLAYIERSRRWLASQKKMLDALANAQAIYSPASSSSRN